VVEIYLEKIRDLLEPTNLNLKIRSQPKRGTFIEGVTEVFVASREELMNYYGEAVENRATLSTRDNDRSSRSHFVMTILIAQEDTQELSVRQGKLFLVDLAGS
jgi:kinesin family protein 5